jgi:hydrogenase maturation protease
MSEGVRTLVLCLGNPLMGDDGLGLHVLARLRREWELDGVELVDGGTWGVYLLPILEDASRLLLIDAIDAGAAPGTLLQLERGDLPRLLRSRLSPHEVELAEVLGLAELRGTLPADTVAVGIQPRDVDLSTELSAEVAATMDALLERVVQRLTATGHACRRIAPPRPNASVLPPAGGPDS